MAEKTQGPAVLVPHQRSDILYSDAININASKFGVVLDFAQKLGPTNQHMVVSRIGISKEHLEELVKVLKGVLGKLNKDEVGEAKTKEVGFQIK